MAYTVTNFKTKKALKEAVVAWNDYARRRFGENNPPKSVRCFNPGLGPDLAGFTGKISLEGPHYPSAHTW